MQYQRKHRSTNRTRWKLSTSVEQRSLDPYPQSGKCQATSFTLIFDLVILHDSPRLSVPVPQGDTYPRW